MTVMGHSLLMQYLSYEVHPIVTVFIRTGM